MAKEKGKKEEDLKQYEGALGVVDQMRNIREQGRLGRTSHLTQYLPFASSTRKDIGEYTTLGNSLISYASIIPIRNRQEFETLTGKLNDPHITDAEAEGVLDGIERIILSSLGESGSKSGTRSKSTSKKEKRPLGDFER